MRECFLHILMHEGRVAAFLQVPLLLVGGEDYPVDLVFISEVVCYVLCQGMLNITILGTLNAWA